MADEGGSDVGGGPDGVGMVPADMEHDSAQWSAAAGHLERARVLAQGELDDHPPFGVYDDMVGASYRSWPAPWWPT